MNLNKNNLYNLLILNYLMFVSYTHINTRLNTEYRYRIRKLFYVSKN